ncbi:hypothetical protein [Halomonas sp. YLGW01]|uniref:hypothetical protein n=1 Tax=Halomonas sp. YLGW01 TaxID=2773308 RepID=UPI00177BDA53|nr:hypothetical protein [Halomonas sp. YLGW01]
MLKKIMALAAISGLLSSPLVMAQSTTAAGANTGGDAGGASGTGGIAAALTDDSVTSDTTGAN